MTNLELKAFLALLSDDPERSAELYLVLLGKLIRYFAWNLCANPEELADEVIDRVARRVAEGESIQSPISYVLGVARRVLLESKPKVLFLPLDGEAGIATEPRDDAELQDLDRCLEELEPESRAILLEYYSADGAARVRVRQEMADRMGLSVNALRNRCLRLRRGLEECIERRRRKQ